MGGLLIFIMPLTTDLDKKSYFIFRNSPNGKELIKMELNQKLKQIKQVCLVKFEELTQTQELAVFQVNLSSYTIWGGNGDRDEDLYIVLTPNGWVERIIESETGFYQKGNGITSREERSVSEEDVVALAKRYEDNAAMERLLGFINKIQERYPEEFGNN